MQELGEEPTLRDLLSSRTVQPPFPALHLPLLTLPLQPVVPQAAGAGALQAQGWAWGLRAGLALGLLLLALKGP